MDEPNREPVELRARLVVLAQSTLVRRMRCQKDARARLNAAVDADRLPVARGERWAATWAIELIGRVLIAVAYGDTPERAVIDQIHIEDALTLLTTARRDVGKLEAQLITAARHGI